MAAAAVRDFLQVRHAELLSRFEPLLEPPDGDPAERAALRGAVDCVAAVERERERDGGAALVVLREQPRRGPGDGQGAREAPEGSPAGMPVAQLKSLFQKGHPEGPKVPGGGTGLRAPPQKPCMLPVRALLPSRAAGPGGGPAEEEEEEQEAEAEARLQVGPPARLPSPSPQPKRRPRDEPGSASPCPCPRRVPKAQKVGEEAACQATVPLEAAEHEWLVRATEGRWSQQLHGLLLSDKSLAGKRDFVSGFTVLHWAAKSGNCDLVTKVMEVAEKGGVRLNVNTKSYGGYTPLHIAALHGQEEIIALLVRDYNAKVSLRDHSGKKPFQYLKEDSSFAVRHLLRDPALHTATGHKASVKKNPKVAASILSSTSTFLGVLSDDAAFYELTKGLKKPASLNKFLHAATAPRRKLKSRGTFSSYSLSESLEEEEEEAATKRRPVSELFFGH